MILIITHKQDYTADFLINKLNSNQTKYLRLNCEDLLYDPQYNISNKSNFETTFGEVIHSVWYRRTMYPEIFNLSIEEKLYFNREFEALLENICCSLEKKKWLSNPFSIRRAENKVLQLKTANDVGFVVPKTLITNSKHNVINFFYSNTNTIIKPLHSGYVPSLHRTSLFFTNILTEENIKNLTKEFLSPCIFQEYIEKEYELRITIVAGRVFSAKVDSQLSNDSKVDWRKSKLKFSIYELPEHVELQCLEICKILGLSFGAIDLVKSTNNEYVFLEINPNGQWAWIEMDTGLPISQSIINFLTS